MVTFFTKDFWPNLNFLLEDQIKLVLKPEILSSTGRWEMKFVNFTSRGNTEIIRLPAAKFSAFG